MLSDDIQDMIAVLFRIGSNAHGWCVGGRPAAIETADMPARLGEDETGRSVVPGHQTELKIELGKPGGYQAQFDEFIEKETIK